MDIKEAINTRHSVRQYQDRPIDSELVGKLNALIEECNEQSGLHIQLILDDPDCFNSFLAHYGKFVGANNYIALVGDKGNDGPIGKVLKRNVKARLFKDFSLYAFLGALSAFKVAADSDPFVLVDIIFLGNPVHHEIFVIPLDIAQGCKLKLHVQSSLSFCLFLILRCFFFRSSMSSVEMNLQVLTT